MVPSFLMDPNLARLAGHGHHLLISSRTLLAKDIPNAKSILQYQKGSTIDKFDLVVRLNKALPLAISTS